MIRGSRTRDSPCLTLLLDLHVILSVGGTPSSMTKIASNIVANRTRVQTTSTVGDIFFARPLINMVPLTGRNRELILTCESWIGVGRKMTCTANKQPARHRMFLSWYQGWLIWILFHIEQCQLCVRRISL